MENILQNEKKVESEQTPTSSIKEKKLLKIKENIRKLPEKKAHLDFLGALLTIPVLLTVIYLNFMQIKSKNTIPTPTPSISPAALSKTVEIRYITNPVTRSNKSITPVIVTSTPQPTQSMSCTPDIGPITISSPSEGQSVSTNPVCINIDYQSGSFCSVVWAYKINSSPLSDYSNNSVCLYNLPSGQNVFQLQVKSLSSASTKTLNRTFTVQTTPSPTPSLTPVVSQQPLPTITAPTGSQ